MAVELKPLPRTFAATRDALHRVAAELVAPARKPHNEIALRQTLGGFGTPEFEFQGRRTQVRVEEIELVLTRDGDDDRAELRSVAAGGALLGPELLPDGVPDDDAPLEVDAEAADRLADFYAFAADLLERLKSGMPPEAKPSDTNLWPEHFDIAFEAGDEAAGHRRRTAPPPATMSTPSPTSTSLHGPRPVTASCGTRPPSTARSSPMRTSGPPVIRPPRALGSCARGTKP